MADYPYTHVPGKIPALLAKIRSTGIPPKVNQPWLKSIGFTSSNDGSLIGVFKFVGLIDSANAPTALWKEYRGAKPKAVLGDAIKKAYAGFFDLYPDADQRSTTEIGHVVSTSSSGGAQVVSKTVATFKALVGQAEFELSPTSPEMHEASVPTGASNTMSRRGASHTSMNGHSMSTGPALHIDLQIHISAESTPQQIDKIFESMAKHLYGRKDD